MFFVTLEGTVNTDPGTFANPLLSLLQDVVTGPVATSKSPLGTVSMGQKIQAKGGFFSFFTLCFIVWRILGDTISGEPGFRSLSL